MQKIVITGCNGLLGQTLLSLFLQNNSDYSIIGISKGENRTERYDFVYENIDITNKTELQACILKHKPTSIINTAAMTNVDECEDNKEACYQLNISSFEYLVEICKQHHIHLVHISTDFIFDGEKGNYKETDTPNPLSYYGLSKLKSEELIIESAISHTILRTILVYGKVNNMSRNNIVLWIIEMLGNNKEITIVNDQYRMPTYVVDLAMACKISIDKKAQGVFNISSSELLSVYEIAIQIAEVFELNPLLVRQISTRSLNQRAPRPPKTGFNLDKTFSMLGLKLQPFKKDLQRFKQTLI